MPQIHNEIGNAANAPQMCYLLNTYSLKTKVKAAASLEILYHLANW